MQPMRFTWFARFSALGFVGLIVFIGLQVMVFSSGFRCSHTFKVPLNHILELHASTISMIHCLTPYTFGANHIHCHGFSYSYYCSLTTLTSAMVTTTVRTNAVCPCCWGKSSHLTQAWRGRAGLAFIDECLCLRKSEGL